MPYFMISSSEDGISVREVTEERIVADLLDDDAGITPDNFLSAIADSDPNYWKRNRLLIRGEIVVPTPRTIEVVKEYALATPPKQ